MTTQVSSAIAGSGYENSLLTQSAISAIMETMETKTYTPNKAATILSVSPQSIRKWLRAGKFPNAFRKSDTKRSGWLIPQADIDAFIQRRQQKVS